MSEALPDHWNSVGETLGHPHPDWPEWCVTFRERKAYQVGVADARRTALAATSAPAEPKWPNLPKRSGASHAERKAVRLVDGLTPEYAEAVRKLAEQQDMSEANVLRAAIRLYQAERNGTATVEFKREMSMLPTTPPAEVEERRELSNQEMAAVAALDRGQLIKGLGRGLGESDFRVAVRAILAASKEKAS